MLKVCLECNQEKELIFFPLRSDNGKYRNICKICTSKKHKSYYSNNVISILNNKKQYELNNKNIISNRKKIYQQNNKEKISKLKKNNYILNKNKILKIVKEYAVKNKEKIYIYQKEYREENKKLIRNNNNIYFTKKFSNDTCFRLRKNISSFINLILKSNNSSKNNKSIINYLPFTIEQLKNHIENLFECWMNWSNYGSYKTNEWIDNDKNTWKWQLDHIIPHSEFKYKTMDCDEFRFCWNLSNLRPYSAKQNVIDGVTRKRHKKENK